MLKLYGFPASNYYNVAKLALLEKRLEFEEVRVYTGTGPDYLAEYRVASPLGKVPCLLTPSGFLTESRCIVDYLEVVVPAPPLYPSDPFAAAKLRELTQIIDLYLELPARRLLPHLFGQTKPSTALAQEVLEVLTNGRDALRKLARFDEYLLGARFTAADIAAVVHLPVVRAVTRTLLDQDPLGRIDALDEYLLRLERRATVQRLRRDQRANYPEFLEHLRSQSRRRST